MFNCIKPLYVYMYVIVYRVLHEYEINYYNYNIMTLKALSLFLQLCCYFMKVIYIVFSTICCGGKRPRLRARRVKVRPVSYFYM